MTAHQRIANLRYVEGAADVLELVDAARGFDEDTVGAGTNVALRAAHRDGGRLLEPALELPRELAR